MTLLEELGGKGADIKDGLNRLMNNEAIYERLLKKLPASIEAQEILSFIDSGDIETAIKNAHTIKGVTGNLSVTPLYTAYTQVVDLLRAGKVEEARENYLAVLPVQKEILDIIKKY